MYDKPIYVGTTILDISKVCMMDFHYNVIHKHFEGRYHLIYSDTDSLVYVIRHEDIYKWIKENPEHFDLSESKRADLKDSTNKKKIGKMKDEMHTLVIKDYLALNLKIHMHNHQALNTDSEIVVETSKVLKGVSTIVVENEIKAQDYKDALEKGTIAKRDVTSLRSFNHQVYTYAQNKVALTSHHDKMKMINEIDCVPFGYNPT